MTTTGKAEIAKRGTIVALLFALAACDGFGFRDSRGGVPGPKEVVASDFVRPGRAPVPERIPGRIDVEPTAARVEVGETQRLSATVYDTYGLTMDTEVTWHSLNPDRVTVDEQGLATTLGPLGAAWVTASAGEYVDEPTALYVVPNTRAQRELPMRLQGVWTTSERFDHDRVEAVVQLSFGPGERFDGGGWVFGWREQITGTYSVQSYRSDEDFTLRFEMPGRRYPMRFDEQFGFLSDDELEMKSGRRDLVFHRTTQRPGAGASRVRRSRFDDFDRR